MYIIWLFRFKYFVITAVYYDIIGSIAYNTCLDIYLSYSNITIINALGSFFCRGFYRPNGFRKTGKVWKFHVVLIPYLHLFFVYILYIPCYVVHIWYIYHFHLCVWYIIQFFFWKMLFRHFGVFRSLASFSAFL